MDIKQQKSTPAIALAESNLATALLFIRSGHILLFRRAVTGFADGLYALPGGKCDQGESVIASGIREAYEEVGITIPEADLEFGHVVHVMHTTKDTVKNWVIFFLVVSRWHEELINKEPNKHAEMRWFPLDKLPEDMIPSHRQGIISLQEKKTLFCLANY